MLSQTIDQRVPLENVECVITVCRVGRSRDRRLNSPPPCMRSRGHRQSSLAGRHLGVPAIHAMVNRCHASCLCPRQARAPPRTRFETQLFVNKLRRTNMRYNYMPIDYWMCTVGNTDRGNWVTEEILLVDTRFRRVRTVSRRNFPHEDIRYWQRQEAVGRLFRDPHSTCWFCVAMPGWEYLLFNLAGQNLGLSFEEAEAQVRATLEPVLSSIPRMVIRPTAGSLAGPSAGRQLRVWLCSHRSKGGAYSEVPNGLIACHQETGEWCVTCVGTELNGLEVVGRTEAQVRIDLVRLWPWYWLEQHWKTWTDGQLGGQWNGGALPSTRDPLRPNQPSHSNVV